MARRKRVEAWANVYDVKGRPVLGTNFQSPSKAARKATYGVIRKGVHLVELRPGEVILPREAADVVRAAEYLVRHLNDHDDNIEPSVLARIVRAVERMQKGRRK